MGCEMDWPRQDKAAWLDRETERLTLGNPRWRLGWRWLWLGTKVETMPAAHRTLDGPDGTRNRIMRVRASRFRPFFSTVSHSRFHRPAGGSLSWSGARGWVARVTGPATRPGRGRTVPRGAGGRGRACKNCFMLCFMLS